MCHVLMSETIARWRFPNFGWFLFFWGRGKVSMGYILRGFFSGGAFLEGAWGISQRIFQGFFPGGWGVS